MMKYTAIFREAIHQFLTNRKVWLFGFISLATTILPSSQYLRGNYILICIGLPIILLISVLSLTATASLIYVVSQSHANNDVNVKEAWHRGMASLLRLFGVVLISAPLFLAYGILYIITGVELNISPWVWIINTIPLIIIGFIMFFSICAIVIDDVSVFSAVRTSVAVTLKNILKLFSLSATISSMVIILLGFVFLILFVSPIRPNLPHPLVFNFLTIQKIMEVPAMIWANRILIPISSIFSTVVLTVAYDVFTQKTISNNSSTHKAP